jgi:hypothetical protein
VGSLGLLPFLLAGCGKEQIGAYQVPKEQAAAAPQPAQANPHAAPGAHGLPAVTPSIRYETPEGWTVKPAGAMRAAQFSIPGKEGQDTEVSVVPLAGLGVEKQDIVNLWRQQIQLPPAKPEELGVAQKVAIGSTNGELYELVSAEPLINQKAKVRILAAMSQQGETTWFFKMTGDDETVRAQKPAFLKFLKSITFEKGADMASAHAMAGVTAPAAANPRGETAAAPAKPQWQVPAGWNELPPTQMVVAKFGLTGKTGGKADVTVSVFPGDVGGVPANVNRWRQQIGLTPVAPAEVDKLTTSLDLDGAKAVVADLSGPEPKSGQKTRLVGIIIPQGGRTWFFKLLGDDPVVEQEKAAFLKFAQTAKLPNAS